MYLQDSKLFMVCQVRNEDIDMSYVGLVASYVSTVAKIWFR